MRGSYKNYVVGEEEGGKDIDDFGRSVIPVRLVTSHPIQRHDWDLAIHPNGRGSNIVYLKGKN